MKNQWFGDIHDFRKYGLLRFLSEITQDESLESAKVFNRILVAWMLTPKVKNDNCGKYRGYVNYLGQWEKCDKDLFEKLKQFNSSARRAEEYNVGKAFSLNILPDSQFVSYGGSNENELSKDRKNYFCKMKKNDSDLIFLDADNGLEVVSMTKKKKPFYILYKEIRSLYAAGKSVLIYQHRAIGQSFATQTSDKITKLQEILELSAEILESRLIVFRGGNVSYFLLCQTEEQKRRVCDLFYKKNYPERFLKIQDF